MVQVSLSTSTTFDGDLNALVEDQGTALTVRFDLDEPAPSSGLRVYVDGDIEQILNRLDLPGAALNPRFENINPLTASTNFDNSGIAITINEGATFATFTLDIFDNPEPDTFLPETFDGLVEAIFSLLTADQVAPEDQSSITGVSDYTIDPDAASSRVLFADDASQLPSTPPPSNDYDEAVSGDISGNPSDPLDLPLAEGTTRLSATTGGGEQEYVTVTIVEGFQLNSLTLDSYSAGGDVAFVGLQEGTTFTEPLDNSADTGNFLGYTLFGGGQTGTDILDNIGNGAGAIGFDSPLESGTYTFALQQLGTPTDYTLAFNVGEAVFVNMPPEAANDFYSATVNEALVIDAAAGVLSNDSDDNGDTLTAAIASDATNGSITLNDDGSFTYTPSADFTGVDSFSYTVSDSNGGTDTADVSINVTDANGSLPVVSFEAIPATISEEGTAEERLLRLVFTVAGEIPEGGLMVLFENLFGITDQLDSQDSRAAFNNLGLVPPFDTENNIIGIRLDANEASMDLPIINDLIQETTTFDFQLLEGDSYIVDPDQNATLFTITDDNGGPGVGPTIGLSVSETNLAEGDTFTVNFTVEGTIPDGGVDVLVLSDESVSGPLGQFDLANLDALQLSGVTNLRPGDDRGQSFIATITETNASITLDVFNDIVAEEAIAIPFTLANGELYEVDPDAASVTLTITDDVQAVGPTVSLSVDETTLVEGDDPITLTISVDGDIPEGGLQVLINDVTSAQTGARSLTEFDIANITTTGVADFPTPADGDSGFFVTVTEPTATITLAAFDEGADEDETAEVFTFEVIDGEAYEVDADAGSVTIDIVDAADAGGGDLLVSLDVLAGTFTADENGLDSLITPNLVLDGSGTPVLSLLLSADGPFPEEGLVVNVQTDLADISQFIQGSNFVPTTFGGQVLGAIYDADGNPTGLQVRLDNRNTVVTFNTGLANPTDGDLPVDINFSLAEGEGYTAVETPAAVALYQDASQLPTPPDPVEVGMSFDGGVLTEGGTPGTLNFTVDGEIPPEGVIVFVSNNQFAGIVDFDLLNATATGGSFPAPDGNAGGFFFKITESSASISFQARVDEDVEGLEQVSITLQPQPGYTIADGAGEVSVLVQDDADSEIQVSLTGAPEVLIEEDGTIAVHTFELSAPPPEEGITVTVIADATQGLSDFDSSSIATTGITGEVAIAESFPEQLTFTITEQTATISLPVAADGLAEGLESVSLTLADPGEEAEYQVDPETNTATFTIVDTAAEVPAEPITEGRFDSIGNTIAEAQATGLSADTSSVTIEASINGNFFDSSRVLTDNTEDVDMYSVELDAGDVLRLDIDARIMRSNDESPDTILRLFDADGNQLSQSDDDFAPDELFAPGRQDSYLEFTAETAGTYYVGVSSFGNGEFGFNNNPYDPNVAGSGTGRSDGAYTLNLSLNEAPGAAATDIPASTGEGPTVSFNASPATYDSNDSLLAGALVQFVEGGSASILTLTLDTESEIPEEGIEVYLTSNIDLSTVFSTGAPFAPVGAEVLGAVYDDAGAPIGLKVNVTGNAAVLNLNLDSADAAPTDGVQNIAFTLEAAAGYQVDDDASFTTVIYDTLADVPAAPTVPTVSIDVSETTLVESEGTLTTLTFTLDSPPPEEGVLVNVDSGVRAALGEFDVFNAEVVGGDFPSPNFRASGFFFRITEQTATLTLAPFDETTNPEIDPEDALEGVDEFTFAVQPGAGYAVSPSANAVTVTIADTPDSVVLPDDGGGDGGSDDSGGLTESELNDTIADAILVDFGPLDPFFEIAGEIGTTRQTRNLVDRSEDVDMYAFNLEAGQTVLFDVDAGGTGDAGVEGSLMDSILRVFDAEGNEVAISNNDGAPDEVFQANGDSYLEFEVTETGTYYVGISNLGNDFYDPNEQGSGSGWIFEDRFEPGPYRLTATLEGAVFSESGDTLSTNNDTIADAEMLDLTADNPNIQVQAEFAQRFEDRSNTVDATEDVDMFKVVLQAGDRITIDADSVTTELEGFQVGPAPDLTIFDANGNPVVVGQDADGEDIFAFSSRDGAPDEAFIANRDAYLDFTAPADGTYYIGVSQYRNSNYDPNVVGSGSGAFFAPRFGVSPGGEYTLDIALNPTGFTGPVFEEFDGTPDEDAPVVTFTTDAGTFVRAENRDDIVISSELIEDGDAGRGVLNIAFSIDGEIPEGGLEVLVKNEEGVDLNDYFQQLGGQPRIVVGGTLTGGLYDADGALIGFKALITDNNALFPFTAATDREDDPNTPETLTFSLANSSDYAASPTANSSEVTFFDSLEQVQANNGPIPTVGFTLDQTEFIESEGTVGTITVTVDGEIPDEGLQVYLDSPDRILGEFDVFNAEVMGGAFPSPNGTASGFFFRVFENTATIKLAVFDETTNDQIPAEDALEGIESFNLALQPLEGYAIDADAAAVDFTIKDNPDSVVIPDDDGNGGGGGETDGPVTDNDGRNTIDDTFETAVATGLSPNQTEVTVEGTIDVRWRNVAEQRADNTEDVDMYSFDLVAGETVNIDATSIPFDRDGITQVTAPTLRVFNAAGEELAISGSELGTDPVVDPSFSFTATETGTYYVGVSQYLNDNYDPLINASGDGVQLVDEGISPGEYTLALTLDTDREAVPTVSMTVNADEVSEEDPNAAVTLTFTIDGEIPEEGLSILFDGSDVVPIFDEIAGDPIIAGFELGDFFDPSQPFLFEFVLLDNTSTVTLNILNDVIEEGTEDFTFSILPDGAGLLGSNYLVNSEAASVTASIVDGNGGPDVGPTVGLTVTETELDEGDRFTVNFTVAGDIPTDGLEVLVDSPTFGALGEFVIFNEDGSPAVEFEGVADFPLVGDGGGSSFLVTITEPTASLTLSVFEDGANEGIETLTFDLINGEVYEVAPDASTVTLTINDFEVVGSVEPDILVGDEENNSLAGLDDDDIIAGGQGDDIILGGDGDDVLRGSENSRDPQNGTNGGNDIIFGGEGNDRIGGKAGNDILSGDAGDDQIWGDDGDDILMGVTGNDILVGDNFSNGSGSDLFVFGNGDGTDTILDFEVGVDSIGLVEGELVFTDLTLIQDGANTLLGVAESGETLAVLNNVQASALGESSFEIVPDVSNPDEALALI